MSLQNRATFDVVGATKGVLESEASRIVDGFFGDAGRPANLNVSVSAAPLARDAFGTVHLWRGDVEVWW